MLLIFTIQRQVISTHLCTCHTDLSYYIQVSKAWLKRDISVSAFVCTFTLIIIQGLTAVLPMKHVSKFVTTFNT